MVRELPFHLSYHLFVSLMPVAILTVIMLNVIILIVGVPCQLGPFGGGGGGGGGRERLKFLFKNNFLKGLASPSYLDDLIKKSIKTKFKEELFLYPTKTWDQCYKSFYGRNLQILILSWSFLRSLSRLV